MNKPKLSKITIMIPPIRPDRYIYDEVEKIENRVKENGLKATVDEILEEYYDWKNEPHPANSRKKRRATLIFSKSEPVG